MPKKLFNSREKYTYKRKCSRCNKKYGTEYKNDCGVCRECLNKVRYGKYD